MMDELELLKKDWQKKKEHLPKLSYNDIHTMIWKKSSSIVKWILVISILEFLLPHLLYLIPSAQNASDIYKGLGIFKLSVALMISYYIIVTFFIFKFYKHYREISVLDNAKSLMSKIIKTRKTVKYYIIVSLSMTFITCAMVLLGMYFDDNLFETFNVDIDTTKFTLEQFKSSALWVMGIGCTVMLLLLGLLYFFLYGRLIRKLKTNYQELKKLEI